MKAAFPIKIITGFSNSLVFTFVVLGTMILLIFDLEMNFLEQSISFQGQDMEGGLLTIDLSLQTPSQLWVRLYYILIF